MGESIILSFNKNRTNDGDETEETDETAGEKARENISKSKTARNKYLSKRAQ